MTDRMKEIREAAVIAEMEAARAREAIRLMGEALGVDGGDD